MSASSVVALVVTVCLVASSYGIQFTSNRQLGAVVFYLSGRSPHDFVNYGCWCRNMDKPTHAPLDEIDQCCQTYQTCIKTNDKSVDPINRPYKATFEDGTIECLNNEQTKAHRQCKCDLDLARCLKKHKAVYTNTSINIPKLKCSPGTVLNFDDLPENDTTGKLPENYHNLTITGGSYMRAQKYLPRPTGYATAMVSSPNVLVSQRQLTIKRTDGQLFSVVSFSVAAAWNSDLQLQLTGSRQYTAVSFNTTAIIQANTRSLINLNWSGIDTLHFNASGGKAYAPYGAYGDTHFAIDDFRVRL